MPSVGKYSCRYTLREAEHKIETLRQEKLFLTQEKAELQGALKYLGKK